MSDNTPSRRRVGKVLAATRSGLRRYPRVLRESIARHSPPLDGESHADLTGIADHDPLAASWLGHASVLLRLAGKTILIDPVFSDRVGMRVGPFVFGPHRLAAPPAKVETIPPIDIILISHAHFDHLDRPSLMALASPDTAVITARGTRRLIPNGFREVLELDWEERHDFDGVEIEAHQPVHWGARLAIDRRRGFNSYVLRSEAAAVLFAGDTANTQTFADLDGIDLAIFGIGAYEPWDHAHATPEQVWSMFLDLGATHLLPVHHSTFELSDEHIDEPMERLVAAAGRRADRILNVRPGDLWLWE